MCVCEAFFSWLVSWCAIKSSTCSIVVVNYCCPTINGGMQNGRSVGLCTHCTHVFARLAPICMLSRYLLTKFLRRSFVGSLLRVRCWLGAFVQHFLMPHLSEGLTQLNKLAFSLLLHPRQRAKARRRMGGGGGKWVEKAQTFGSSPSSES